MCVSTEFKYILFNYVPKVLIVFVFLGLFMSMWVKSLSSVFFFFCAGVETDNQSIDAVRGPEPHLIWPPHHRHSGLFLPVPEADVKGFNGELVLLCSASVWIVKISASWYFVNKQYLFFSYFHHRKYCTATETRPLWFKSSPQCSVTSTGNQSVRRRESLPLRRWREELFFRMLPSLTPRQISQRWR